MNRGDKFYWVSYRRYGDWQPAIIEMVYVKETPEYVFAIGPKTLEDKYSLIGHIETTQGTKITDVWKLVDKSDYVRIPKNQVHDITPERATLFATYKDLSSAVSKINEAINNIVNAARK